MNLTHPVTLAGTGDATAIASMSRDLVEQGLPWNWRPERVARAIAARHTNVAVVQGAVGLAGFAIMAYAEDDAHLLLLGVDRDHRRRGVGSALVGWLEASAMTWGCARVHVETRRDNADGRLFYNENGYHEVALQPRMYGRQVDGVRLEKWLRSPAAA